MKVSLKSARINANLSQEEVAKVMGVTRQTVMNWEGCKGDIKTSTLRKLCSLYKCDISDIFLPDE